MWFTKKPMAAPSDVYLGLREQIFTIAPAGVGVGSEAGHQRVWAVVMEMGRPDGVATLVAIADGTTSLYTSTGGGIIGAGQHATVRDATARFIALVDSNRDALPTVDDHPLPEAGRVRFYARTFDGLRGFEAGESEPENDGIPSPRCSSPGTR